MGYIAKIIIGLLIIYAVTPLLSFLPWFIGMIYKSFTFPVQLFRQIVYPVGPMVDIVWIGGVFFFVALSILSLVNKKV